MSSTQPPRPRTYAPARGLLTEYLELRRSLGAARSPEGGQLEAMRQGMTGKPDDAEAWRRANAAEERYIRLGELGALWSRLTPQQQRVIELANEPDWSEHHTRRCTCPRRPCLLCELGGQHQQRAVTEPVQRSVPLSEVQTVVLEGDARVTVRLTERGEEVVSAAEEPGHVVVETRLARRLTLEQIARRTGQTRDQVRRELTSAYAAATDWATERASRRAGANSTSEAEGML